MSLGPSLALAVRRHAAAGPLAVAIVDPAGPHSAAALDAAADGTARGLEASGIAPGDRVALLAAPSFATLAALVGIWRAGATAVPLSTRLAPREIARALDESTPALLVHDPGLGGRAGSHDLPALALDALAARSGRAPRRDVDVDPRAPAVIVLTSGTTGRPKAAILSHAALQASATAWSEALPPATGWLLCLGLAHVAGLGVAWRALGAGVPLHVVVSETPAVLAALSPPEAPSHVSLVPVQLARLLDAVRDAPPPASLRAVLLGGAPIPPELIRRAVAARWPVVPTYGLTEGGSGVTAMPAEEAGTLPGSAGRPLPGVAVRIADPRPDGVGEIQVRTPAAFSGYLGAPAETAAAFTRDGWLRTGDLGFLDGSARLVVADRRDDLVISGGENVSPAEVEAVLAAHPAVADVGVAGRPHPTWGSVPVAGIVLRRHAHEPGDEALRAWCTERLAAFKVPAAFVRLDTLPRTSAGKLRRADLRDRLTPLVVVLHAVLSTGRQLAPLLRELGAAGDLRVLAPDRRGSGERRLDPPRTVTMEEHLADLATLLDEESAGRVMLLGHSYGGVVALEAAARMPERVAEVIAYEPPYGPVADARTQRAFQRVAMDTARAGSTGGAPAAARTFVRGVAGLRAWDGLPGRTRRYLEGEGGSAIADAGMVGLQPAGLTGIACPVTIITGAESESFYAPIADALVALIPGARRIALLGLRHTAPITDPAPIAVIAREAFAPARPRVAPPAPAFRSRETST